MVALNSGSTAVLSTFTGDVKVELVNASDNTGALTGSCRASWVPIAASATTLTFASGDSGRKSVSLTTADAYRDVRVRFTYPATGPANVRACSTDNFAIRPASFTLRSSDTDWESDGTPRDLNNVAASGGNVHKAGRSFTLRATAVNSTGVTTINYSGTPSHALTPCAGPACAATLGTMTAPGAAVAGISDSSVSYSEVGSFALQLTDTTFAAVDAADGSSAGEKTIASSVIDVGRFVPDHFTLLAGSSISAACNGFTYMAQPNLGIVFSIEARNFSEAKTANYSGSAVALIAENADSGSNLGARLVVPGGAWNLGSYSVSAGAASFSRNATPDGPFDSLLVGVRVDDADGVVLASRNMNPTTSGACGGSCTGVALGAATSVRFGILHLTPAYGSDLLDLPVPVEARYWNGVRWATNVADSCTALPTSALAMGFNVPQNLSACETALAPTTLTLLNGRARLILLKPGNGNTGSVDLTARLATAGGNTCPAVGGSAIAATPASLSWLLGGAAFDTDPTTRASFGQFGRPRSPIIYQRELY